MTSQKLDYIDALRGWAVLLVISSHVSGPLQELPYPVRKLSNFGWYGVQLFFLASAITLLLSWHADHRQLRQKVPEFFIRRFFRIAPLYYLGALLYFLIDPPLTGFDPLQLLRALAFVNGWHPQWVPTTPGWMVVPGGWSISVEFSFYLLFPLLVTVFRGALGAGLFFILAGVVAVHLNPWLAPQLESLHGAKPASNFLYFWLINQLPIFALGFAAYSALRSDVLPRLSQAQSIWGFVLLSIVVVGLAEFYGTRFHYFHSLISMPMMFWAAVCFLVLIYLLSHGDLPWLKGLWIRRLGELSFSMYLLHFAVLHAAGPLLLRWWGHVPTGLEAVAAYALLWAVTVVATAGCASLTYRHVEEPGNRAARALITWMRLRRTQASDASVVGRIP